jgi:hypothetical protein
MLPILGQSGKPAASACTAGDDLGLCGDDREAVRLRIASARGYLGGVNLIDSVAQWRTPFVVRDDTSGEVAVLNNTADCAPLVAQCPLRYVLADGLTRLCTDLAYSRGAGTLACADLLRAPAQRLWVEWCDDPFRSALKQYGFPDAAADCGRGGRRGMWVRSSPSGRRGLIRTFWSASADDVLASSVEAYFDFDTAADEEPEPLDGAGGNSLRVEGNQQFDDDILGRCFRFRYEQSWSRYYGAASLSAEETSSLWQHSISTIALDVPLLLAFLLLLATRNGLPQRAQTFERLNRRRLQRGKAPLLEHIEVRAPMLPEQGQERPGEPQTTRVRPRLHHVRGHLVRRGSQLFWRVPHLRGSARSGIVRTRTVIWDFGSARGVV